jgi:hypothetical protein
MKKIVLFCALYFSAFSGVYAETDQATIDFLGKLNSHYYCLMREGLKSFQSEVKCSLFENYVKQCSDKYGPTDKRTQSVEKAKFIFSYPAKEEISLDITSYFPCGDPDFDARTAKLMEIVKAAFKENIYPWKGNVLEPVFGADDFKKFNFQIQKKDDGYVVYSTGDRPVTEYIDNQWRIFALAASPEAMIPSCKLQYASNPKGMVLSGVVSELPKNSCEENIKMEYQSVDGFTMPLKMTVSIQKTGASNSNNMAVVFDFANYLINQGPEEKK